MKNIYFFDIDNTLIDHDSHTIPESAVAAIKQLKEQGNTVVIATGRSDGHAKPYIELIDPDYVIVFNGALVMKDSRPIFSSPLPPERLTHLFDWIHSLGHSFGVNLGENAFVSEAVDAALIPLNSVKLPVQSVGHFNPEQAIYQGWLFFDESLDSELFPQIYQRYPEFTLVRWHQTGADILHKHVNKWTACQQILQRTGFRPDEAIAFGDGLNDIQMIQGVGLGIAMGNGHPKLKAVADRVAPPLLEDGIARMLETLALEMNQP